MSELHPSHRKTSWEWMLSTEALGTQETQGRIWTASAQPRGGQSKRGHVSVREVTGTAGLLS